MVLFDKCCFCIPLKTGCFILSYLQLVGSILGIVVAGMTVGAGLSLTHNSDKDIVEAAKVVLVIGAVLLVLYLVVFCISIVLLVGMHKRKPSLIKAYLIFGVITVVLNLIVFAVQLTYTPSDKILGVIIKEIVTIALSIYFLLVFKSYYTILKEEQQTPNMRMQKI